MDDISMSVEDYADLVGKSARSIREWAARALAFQGGARAERTNPAALERASWTILVPRDEYERLRSRAAARGRAP